MEVECVYPEYLGRPPRRLPITGGMRIPEGTELTLHADSTKPLTDVRVHKHEQSAADVRSTTCGRPVEEIRWDYGTLTADDVLTIHVTDYRRRRQPRAVSHFALRDAGRAAASLGAARRHRHGDHARCHPAARGQSDRRLRPRSHLVRVPGRRRRRPRASARSSAGRRTGAIAARRLRHARSRRTRRRASDGTASRGRRCFSRCGRRTASISAMRRVPVRASSLRSTW